MLKTEQTFPIKLDTAQRSLSHAVEKTKCLTRAVRQVIQDQQTHVLDTPEAEALLARVTSVRQELDELEGALQQLALRSAT